MHKKLRTSFQIAPVDGLHSLDGGLTLHDLLNHRAAPRRKQKNLLTDGADVDTAMHLQQEHLLTPLYRVFLKKLTGL